jgi:plasmid maintenance system antidote protein VapI
MQLRSKRTLSDFIRLLGLTERGFAILAGLSHSTVNHLVSGRRRTCSAATAEAIETALGCPSGLLFSHDHAPD